ncbi:GIY-YIG nuclease family protein [Arenibaculum sp.]|jgi:hypothetical protein|uniref:GIY-YIG nuclease family protein n=1 Tax=Arenibaculum sp. TaxID=2865862 RepID=UPI002E12D61E|nr:GIY-YIG nuclease family protein [Arenibaculum sp.]
MTRPNVPSTPGLYIVTLKNKQRISVNRNDRRIAHLCITVNPENCKFGHAKDLARRYRDYCSVFRERNVVFHPIATLLNPRAIERAVLDELRPYRKSGRARRLTEWLEDGFPARQVADLAAKVLAEHAPQHVRLPGMNLLLCLARPG